MLKDTCMYDVITCNLNANFKKNSTISILHIDINGYCLRNLMKIFDIVYYHALNIIKLNSFIFKVLSILKLSWIDLFSSTLKIMKGF